MRQYRRLMLPSQRIAESLRDKPTAWRTAAWWLAVCAITVALLVLRRPDAVLNPQFFAEDGAVWFQQACNDGAINSLLRTNNGYFQTFSRLVAIMALGVPLQHAPLVLNLTAILVEALPALFLVSSRMRNLGGLPLRCALALLYLMVPNAGELHANITNAPWNLALLAFLVLIAEAPRSWAGCVFDLTVMVLMAVTGPFSLLLLPVAVLHVGFRQKTWKTVLLVIITGGAALQGLAILLAGHHRTHQELGASFAGFCRIVAGQVVLPVLEGRNRLDHLAHSAQGVSILACLVTVLAALVFGYALMQGGPELRSFVLFALLLLTASLAFPTPNATGDQWVSMQQPGGAGRYWYIPEMAVMAVMLWLLGRKRAAVVRAAAAVLICFMVLGAMRHWRYPSFPDVHFAEYVGRFDQLPPGASLKIPINPQGWEMTLVRK
jgi:hypothetical protein